MLVVFLGPKLVSRSGPILGHNAMDVVSLDRFDMVVTNRSHLIEYSREVYISQEREICNTLWSFSTPTENSSQRLTPEANFPNRNLRNVCRMAIKLLMARVECAVLVPMLSTCLFLLV
jgi:hypothetical protein